MLWGFPTRRYSRSKDSPLKILVENADKTISFNKPVVLVINSNFKGRNLSLKEQIVEFTF